MPGERPLTGVSAGATELAVSGRGRGTLPSPTTRGRTVSRMTSDELLRTASTILLNDWPTRDVPDTLAQAGYRVVASEGPGPEDYNAYEVEDGVIVDLAKQIGARAVWCETGSAEARSIVESMGLAYVDQPPIADAVRAAVSRS